MADTTIIKARIQYAVNGDTSTLPLAVDYGNGKDYTTTAPQAPLVWRGAVPTTGRTINLSNVFTTPLAAYVLNEDVTNFVEVTSQYTDLATVAHTNVQKVLPGQPLLLGPIDAAAELILTADTTDVTCTVVVVGN